MSEGFSAPLVSACCCDESKLSSASASVLRADSRDRAKLSSASTSLFYAGCCERTKLSTAFELLTAVVLDEEHPFAREMVASMIELIFAQLAKDETQPLSSRASLIVEAFMKDFEEHYGESRSAAFYAQRLFISVNYLNKCCKFVEGISTQECINRRLVFHAKRLLNDRKLIIKEVAIALGFPNLTSFSKFFRNQTGQSPTDYQRRSDCSNDV
jgi:AraC-like DNA-binding protein